MSDCPNKTSIMRDTWSTDKLFCVFITNWRRANTLTWCWRSGYVKQTCEVSLKCAVHYLKHVDGHKTWVLNEIMGKTLFNKWTEHLKKTETLIQKEKRTIISRQLIWAFHQVLFKEPGLYIIQWQYFTQYIFLKKKAVWILLLPNESQMINYLPF